MAHSFATTANLTCAACHQPFAAELWLLVDHAKLNTWLTLMQEVIA